MAAAQVTKAKGFETYLKDASPEDIEKYGYEDSTPGTVWPEESKKPSAAHQYAEEDLYGYVDAAEEDLYGYGDAAPTPRNQNATRAPRRSSMKGSGPAGVSRRASIGYTGEMTLVLPMGKQAQRKTSISFADDSGNSVKNVDSVCNLVDDPNRLWFQQEEYAHIKAKIMSIAKQSKGGGERPTWLCSRGLEALMDGSGAMDRMDAYEQVMDEQRMQKAQGRWDDNYIREVYEFSTIDSKVKAAQRAEEDAKDVEKYLDITRKMCRRLSC